MLHALDIIESFRGADKGLGVTELANRLKLHKNNVFRLLATLQTRGYVEQDKSTDNYRLGVKTFEMGQMFVAQTRLQEQARPVMEELSAATNETVYLSILLEDKTVYLDSVETRQSVRVANRVGVLLPAHCTAVGKAQLAYLGEDELGKIFNRAKLPGFTKNTITDRAKLFTHLKGVAKKGYALDLEELEEEVLCIAVPVKDYKARVVAGVCISGPGCRFSRKQMETELLPQITQAGEEISRKLGYSPERG